MAKSLDVINFNVISGVDVNYNLVPLMALYNVKLCEISCYGYLLQLKNYLSTVISQFKVVKL